ncbi:MAG: HAMP domain-containing histidine kinase [Lachnospiraceae bacterium]|nr:HAMP domain-containing histidine kinase [Lachnospiraceae bacterium]
MSRFKGFACLIIIIEIIIILICNVFFLYENKSNEARLYRVEVKRVKQELQEMLPKEIDLNKYDTLLSVTEYQPEEICNNDYAVEEVNGQLYRIEYDAKSNLHGLFYFDMALLVMLILTCIVLCYVNQKVIKPFHSMTHLSYELAKGNLSVPIQEEKSKVFGRFLWGMDMLREKLEENKEKELEFKKDKKTLILSLSHDIKTPLSSIELYAKALSDNLYDTEDKKEEALQGIKRNTQEIKRYVNEIVTASREEFLNLTVVQNEFYLWEIIKPVEVYYRDKLAVIHTDFSVETMNDCLLKGDKNRLIEVLQNIMENAIKYGDGKSIRIYGEDEEDCKLIHVENSGCSLKEEEFPNIFDSFYRGSNSHGIKGNGLGLYICKSLMRKMDGEVFGHVQNGSFIVTVVIRKAI